MSTLVLAFFLTLVGLETHGAETARSDVPIGSQVDRLTFTDIRGLQRELSELGDYKAKVFVFSNTTCPLVKKYLPRLVELDSEFRSQGVLFVAVNVGSEDTVRKMAAQAVDFQVPFYFVKDMDFSCATRLGARKTPEVVVLDADNVIRYRGRIDDQLRIGGTKPEASREDLKEALREILADLPVTIAQTEVDGCWITPVQGITATPETVTWASHVADLIHHKCTHCHRPGTAAPFELMSYEDVASNADMIADVVRLETMPPWYASRAHGEFQNDASLSPEEKRMLIGWIKAGYPEGDSDKAPSVPDFPEPEWGIGEPDLVITMKEVHTIPATGFIPYKYVLLPHYFAEETWVEAFEIRPLNRAVVHHCNMFHMSAAGAGANTFITGYVPGGQPMDLGNFDNGVAYRLPAGSSLGLQIHYTSIGTEQEGQIQVGLRFPRREIKKQLHHFVLDPRGWTITPYEPAFRIEASHQLKHNANLLGMFTHMHVRGRDMTFFAKPPDENSEILLQIPNYNFEWQLGYELAPGKKVFPKGTKIQAVAHFDNSPFNPYNPDPSAAVEYGPQTVDEMFNGFVFYVDQDETLSIRVDPSNGQVIEE